MWSVVTHGPLITAELSTSGRDSGLYSRTVASELGKTLSEWAAEGWDRRPVDPPIWVYVLTTAGERRTGLLTTWLRGPGESEWSGWCGHPHNWQPASRIVRREDAE